ncbi:unnamed protein product [Sphagnum troendelagicum]|uniref:Uncharacterized protein n=1 Tax=Sphagnum troendelagicum TaxID=128251 RepID=A0ABP0UHT5_9BRYO
MQEPQHVDLVPDGFRFGDGDCELGLAGVEVPDRIVGDAGADRALGSLEQVLEFFLALGIVGVDFLRMLSNGETQGSFSSEGGGGSLDPSPKQL